MKTNRKVMNLLKDRTRFLHRRATVQNACVYPSAYITCVNKRCGLNGNYFTNIFSISLIMCKSSELFEIVKVCDEAFGF